VAFTLSFELTLLVTRSVVAPVRELVAATERVMEGDLSTRVPVSSGDEMGELASGFNKMLTGLEERERLRNAFGSYVDPDVAERVLAEGAALEGEGVEVTVFFVDICDFTSRAERSTPRETVAFLNEYFGLIVPILRGHGGFVNKFMGDGLLGVFGAPARLEDHATRAVRAACAIAEAVDERYGDDISIGIGIDTGDVSAGSVGGGGRLEFTVIGDAVNVAARVERATRELGDRILATDSTCALVDESAVSLEPRGHVRLRGVSEPVRVYAVSGVEPLRARPGGAVPGSVR
jgi:class 3 adenylate cyclase